MPIYRSRQACEILPTVNAPSLKLACEVRGSALQTGCRRLDSGKHGYIFIEVPCILAVFGRLPAVVAGTSADSVVGALFASDMNAFELPRASRRWTWQLKRRTGLHR